MTDLKKITNSKTINAGLGLRLTYKDLKNA